MTRKKTCGGACCKRFVLPYSPEELQEQYRAWLVGSRDGHASPVLQKRGDAGDEGFGLKRSHTEEHLYVDPEIYLIYPMLDYLGYENFEPKRPRKRIKERMHHYTCKHFCKISKRCTIYENRPLMCRRFPNGDACPYPECQLPGNKKKLAEQKRRAKKFAVLKENETVRVG